MLELYRKSNSAITLKFDFSRLKHMGNTNFPIKGKSCYVTRTGTGFRFPGAAEDKPEPGSGSRELPETNRNRVPVPTSCRGQNRNRVPVPTSCRGQNRNRVPVPASCRRQTGTEFRFCLFAEIAFIFQAFSCLCVALPWQSVFPMSFPSHSGGNHGAARVPAHCPTPRALHSMLCDPLRE